MINVAIYRNSDSSSLYKCFAIQSGGDNFDVDKRSQRATFKDVCANCFCASLPRTKFTRHVMHRARALSSKVNNKGWFTLATESEA